MGHVGLRRAVAAGAILSGVLLVQAVPVNAATSGPTVIAAHRNGAIDVPGNSTLGTIAKVTVPAGNWSISATATVIGTTGVNRVECQLIAGAEFYKSRTLPSGQGAASYQAMTLLLAHHFAKSGTVALKCYSDGWLGDVLMRDVHLTAVKVAALTDQAVHSGSGRPAAIYAQNSAVRGWTNNGYNDVEDMSMPVGTWLVQATLWGISTSEGDRVDCSLQSISTTADQSFNDFELFGGERSMALEGVFTFSSPDDVFLNCKDSVGLWVVDGSALSALQVGTLKYGQLGGSATTSGSGSPSLSGGYGGPGGILSTTSLSSIASLSLGAGSWWVSGKMSLQAGVATKVTCQVQVSTAADQGRAILDTANNLYNWLGMSLTKKLSSTGSAVAACNQSGGSLGAAYFDLKLFALKAGTLTDTDLD